VTKTCLQCGAVLPSNVGACRFCDSSFTAGFSSSDEVSSAQGSRNSSSHLNQSEESAWQGELARRVDAYRTRRRKSTPDAGQSQLPFDQFPDQPRASRSVGVAEGPQPAVDDFSFTIAIGRTAPTRESRDAQMLIDVSLPPKDDRSQERAEESSEHAGLYPVASIDDRRLSALADAGCLLFAYGGFLALFSSLGGQFTVSKLSAAVCVSTFAIVYLQYFALFTIFGGTTPGMMLRGLQVVAFSGEQPTPRQMLLRSVGYVLSAGTFFLGFLWASWDEDALTWHDRLSKTYLSSAETFAQMDAHGVAHGR
jgi:uncharacterized RDD family membrane protein YckC